jgi:hypothetical protein
MTAEVGERKESAVEYLAGIVRKYDKAGSFTSADYILLIDTLKRATKLDLQTKTALAPYNIETVDAHLRFLIADGFVVQNGEYLQTTELGKLTAEAYRILIRTNKPANPRVERLFARYM